MHKKHEKLQEIAKNCQITKMQKKCQKQLQFSYKIAKNRGRDFPEGQLPTLNDLGLYRETRIADLRAFWSPDVTNNVIRGSLQKCVNI